MKNLFPNPKTATEARRQANIAERAKTLFTEQGYYSYYCGNGIHGVYSPGGERSYSVNVKNDTCTCPDFTEHRDFCKHLVAITDQLEAEADEAACAEVEALEASRE